MIHGKIFRRIAGGLALLGSLLAGPLAAAKAPPGPGLWQVSDADTTIYLFGTIHVLPEKTKWRSPALERALARSDTLVLEFVMDDPNEATNVMASLGISPGLPPLAERVPADKREVLQKIVRESQLSAALFDSFETWAAALSIIQITFPAMGFRQELGIEPQLTDQFRKSNKPLLGLETAKEQMGFLDSLSEDAQRTLLASAIEDPVAAKAELNGMIAAWMSGNTDAIAATFDTDTQLSPELRNVLFLRRNAAWSEWIARRMAQPGTLFLAVGAGHLAGPDSVQELLKGKGLRVERLN